ncbi:Fc receptor-like protein 2 [Astyanax mexicanus]|uniref:Fc receptor-like protein 2 n=1 Tax=Astyanax mexicanus TaxID=7994 RepID=A0A8T2LZ25_ASTMX|nr:Fc receptor-like protein 2 [Astyanax mexicanus]
MGISLLSVLLLLIKLIHCGQAKEKPTLTVNPHPTVYNGEPLTLTCDLKSSFTGWKFMWFNFSQPLQPLTPEYKNTLSITASDKGTAEYQCAARIGENDPGYSDRVKITVKKHKTTLRVNPDTTVYTGETFTLTCDLNTSHTGWKFTWYKVSTQLESMKEKGPNTFNITASDKGSTEYQCIAHREVNGSDYGSEHSNKLQITVRAPPKPKLTSSLTGSALRGSSVTLECELDQSAGWKFYWYKNTQKNQIWSSTETHCTISIVSDSDGGQYWCRARRGNILTPYSDAFSIQVTESPKAVVSVNPDKDVFRGETVTLRCDIQSGGDTEWKYSWFMNDHTLQSTSQEYRFSPVRVLDSIKFSCRGERKRDSVFSEISDALTLSVFGEAQAVLSVSPQSWLTEGDSVTLSCEVRHSSTGWRFSWYRDGQELVSDSRREAGGSYTLSPAALDHTGVYECRATRGKPAFHTQTSNPLWITASSPPVSLMVGPSRTQHFTEASLSLSCEGQSDSTGWRVRRYTHSEKVSDCTSVWGSGTGSTCSISSLSTSHTGVYWCQSESGGRSYPAIITAHNGDVILDSPVHPVSEGASLTLRCLYRLPKPSNLSADFYKDGSFLQTQPAGEMIIPAASKIHEGFYHCKNPEKGESPTSWISVRVAEAPFSVLCLLSCLLAASPYLLASVILGVKCYRARAEPDEVNRTKELIEEEHRTES